VDFKYNTCKNELTRAIQTTDELQEAICPELHLLPLQAKLIEREQLGKTFVVLDVVTLRNISVACRAVRSMNSARTTCSAIRA
jgi:hypothetical protein